MLMLTLDDNRQEAMTEEDVNALMQLEARARCQRHGLGGIVHVAGSEDIIGVVMWRADVWGMQFYHRGEAS
jgi:hypothetical protein